MKILLVAPPALWGVKGVGKDGEWSYFDLQKKFLGSNARTFPAEHLGLRSIQAYCREKGYEVEVINGHVLNHLSVEETWSSMEEKRSEMGRVDLVGFTGTLEMFEENIDLAKRVKAKWEETITVLGHDFASLNFGNILKNYQQIDIVIRGEGEYAFTQLASALSSGSSFSEVENIAYRDGSDIRVTPIHEGLDLDLIPFADRGDLPYVIEMGLAPAIFTSRGCLYRCNYCTTGQVASLLKGRNSYRMRSVEKVVDEIEYLINEYDIDWITFVDDLFVGNETNSILRATEFANEIIRRNVKINFKVDCRIDSINDDLFKLLAQAGLKEIFVGIETASDEQLEFYNKIYKRKSKSQFDVIKEKIDTVHKYNISVSPGILTYHPTVTKQQLQLTLELIDYCKYTAPYPLWSTITIYPGTPLYQEYKNGGWLEGEWPYLGWRFADEKAENHYRRVKRAALSNRFDFNAMKDAFMEALYKWDEVEHYEDPIIIW